MIGSSFNTDFNLQNMGLYVDISSMMIDDSSYSLVGSDASSVFCWPCWNPQISFMVYLSWLPQLLNKCKLFSNLLPLGPGVLALRSHEIWGYSPVNGRTRLCTHLGAPGHARSCPVIPKKRHGDQKSWQSNRISWWVQSLFGWNSEPVVTPSIWRFPKSGVGTLRSSSRPWVLKSLVTWGSRMTYGSSPIWRFPFRHRGSPSHHPFQIGIFPNKNQPFLGIPILGTPPFRS